jgi:hypothetical protein
LALAGALIFSSSAKAELLIFGGNEHDIFLGCLDCGKYDSDSICNEYGKGSEYNGQSIFNEYGSYGSEYSSSSPWNEYSSSDSVPVLVDREGKFYGYFTINQYRSNAVGFADKLAKMHKTANGDLKVVRNMLCGD